MVKKAGKQRVKRPAKPASKARVKYDSKGRIVVKLPDKSSALIRMAIRELKKREKSSRYRICMADWHSPNGKCAVCLAGSIISNYITPDKEGNPDDFDEKTANKLYALDFIRQGAISNFCNRLGKPTPSELSDYVWVQPYVPTSKLNNNDDFYEQLEKIARLFAALGD